ncbi:unnamed protein product [Cuscuta europaea]|uniref:Uncharacterized protein n=1 Tax=Cuscuta europaea TaxID=41803 RepID=A0A9P0Z9Y7_CUSEU|nr:unnamed protein product [Cuscuta europaea]
MESVENDEEQCIGSLHKNKKKQSSSSKAVPKSQQNNTAKGTFNVKVEVPEEPNRKRSSNKISDCKAKPMKQEAVDDFQVCKSKAAVKKTEKKKMKDVEQEDEDDSKDCKSKNAANKTEKEKVKKEEEDLQIITGKKKEKKVYDLPGQKRDPPGEGDPLRIFYESLYKQLPESDMATIWMMESGLLPKEKAAQVFEKRQKKSIKFSSPMKAVGGSVKRESDCVNTKEKKKRNRPSPAASQRKRTAPSKMSNKNNKNKRMKDDDDAGLSDADDDDDFVAAPRKKRKTSS